jgi:CRP-like cAMP-binding protein
VIVSGSVKIYQKAQDGREKILCVLGPAEFFGEFSLVEGQPRSGQRPHASAHGDALSFDGQI